MKKRPRAPEGYDDNPPLDGDFYKHEKPARSDHPPFSPRDPDQDFNHAGSYSLVNLWASAYSLHQRTMRENVFGNFNRSDDFFLRAFSGSATISDQVVNDFLAEYQVVRSFPKGRQDYRTQIVNYVISRSSQRNTCSLHSRAVYLLEKLPKIGKALNMVKPISAATKLAWFVSPRDWMIYDSRAANTLDVRDWERFYRKLDEFQSLAWFEAVREKALRNQDGIFAERILDKALYILGGTDSYKVISRPHSYEALNTGRIIARLEESGMISSFLQQKFGLR